MSRLERELLIVIGFLTLGIIVMSCGYYSSVNKMVKMAKNTNVWIEVTVQEVPKDVQTYENVQNLPLSRSPIVILDKLDADEVDSSYNRLTITHEERELLHRLVEAEASICDYETKVGIASVVINRVLSDKYPDTIREVIEQPVQFSVVANGSIDRISKITDETLLAVEAALQQDSVDNALWFYVKNLSSTKGKGWFQKQIDSGRCVLVAKLDRNVEFYKERE